MIRTLFILLFTFTVLCGFAQKPPEMVKAQLVSEQSQILPGQAFTVGLHLKHKEGWHTYWENPGDVGIPPMFKWSLPTGWKAGPVQYQAPQKVKMFDITAHGFSGTEALHLVELTPPDTFDPDAESVELKADVTWMLCGRSCHPGTFPFSLRIPVGEEPRANADWFEAFEKVRRDHPRSSKAWVAKANKTKEHITLELRPKPTDQAEASATVKEPVYYGLDKQVFSNRPHLVEAGPDLIRFVLPRSDYGPDDKTDLEAVLHAPGGWHADGSLRYLQVRVAFTE